MKFLVRDKIAGLIEHETDRQTQEAFEKLFDTGRLCFYLECMEGRFEIPQRIPLRTTRKLVHDDNDPVQRSLFDYVPDDLNEYERSVALYLDRRPEVLWWYRNLVGPENFAIQGYKRSVAEYFEKIGRKVSWQKLGEDFQDQTSRFEVLDEGEYEDRDWQDDLKRFLEESAAYASGRA